MIPDDTVTHLIEHSPFLKRLAEFHPDIIEYFHRGVAEEEFERLCQRLSETTHLPTVMQELRIRKQRVALICALAECSKHWSLLKVTTWLSRFAEFAVETALNACWQEQVRQKILLQEKPVGIFILGLGKLGGKELNYSSDIDLMVLFEPERIEYHGRYSLQHAMTKLVQSMISVLQDKTRDGYVFRTDLRLRPDPSSTPLAVNTNAAQHYYETVGQNWERAALIKARIVAGDREIGDEFLRNIHPFLWRQHLDFAAIADIVSIKRQMQAKQDTEPHVFGYNVKTGRGGIREIEFLAQIHQLIWGGRHAELRIRPTLDVLAKLVELELIPHTLADTLSASYHFFRMVEHRLQILSRKWIRSAARAVWSSPV
jgi:glutamate-ammonia-ligase adenylyltransferase